MPLLATEYQILLSSVFVGFILWSQTQYQQNTEALRTPFVGPEIDPSRSLHTQDLTKKKKAGKVHV
jgi:hypothetical protein